MKKYLLIFFIVGTAFGIDKISIPVDFDTASVGKKGYLADNYEEIEDKTNLLIDSTQQIRDVMSGYTTDLTITSQESMIIQLDEDTSSSSMFLVLNDLGDTLIATEEDSTTSIYGELGVGTTSPSYTIDAYNATQTADLRLRSGGGAANILLSRYDTTSSSSVIFKTEDAANPEWYIGTSIKENGRNFEIVSLIGALSYSRMAINRLTGYVGINKLVPTEMLDVVGNAVVSGDFTAGGGAFVVDSSAGTVTFSGSSLKSDTVLIGGGTSITEFGTGWSGNENAIYFSGTSINSEGVYSSNSGAMSLNLYGYNGAQAYDRDLRIYNGKGTRIVNVDGGELDVSVYGDLSVTGDFSVNTSLLFADSSAGMVGIGTASPNATLDLNNSTGNLAALRVTRSAAFTDYYTELGTVGGSGRLESFKGNLTIGADANDADASSYIQFKVDNTEYARLNNNGMLGIGTTSPQALLHTSGGGTTFSPGANTQAIFEDTTNSQASIISGATSQLNFGDYASETVGNISYDHTTDVLSISSGGAYAATISATSFQVDQDLTVVGEANFDSNVVISGDYIDMPVKTTTGDPTGAEGRMYVNTQDNALRLYADGAWRSVYTW